MASLYFPLGGARWVLDQEVLNRKLFAYPRGIEKFGFTRNRRERAFGRWCQSKGYLCVLFRQLCGWFLNEVPLDPDKQIVEVTGESFRDGPWFASKRQFELMRDFWENCPSLAKNDILRAYRFKGSTVKWVLRRTAWYEGSERNVRSGAYRYAPDFFVVFSEYVFGFVEVKSAREQLNRNQRSIFPELIQKAVQSIWLVRVEPGRSLSWYRLKSGSNKLIPLSDFPAERPSKGLQAR